MPCSKPSTTARRGLLFPSRFEGFGWPVVEAQACGCPVLCSDAGSLGEVAGESAFVRAAADEEAFADELARVAVDDEARARWAEKGFRNAARFTADAMLDHYERLYDELSGQKNGPQIPRIHAD